MPSQLALNLKCVLKVCVWTCSDPVSGNIPRKGNIFT